MLELGGAYAMLDVMGPLDAKLKTFEAGCGRLVRRGAHNLVFYPSSFTPPFFSSNSFSHQTSLQYLRSASSPAYRFVLLYNCKYAFRKDLHLSRTCFHEVALSAPLFPLGKLSHNL